MPDMNWRKSEIHTTNGLCQFARLEAFVNQRRGQAEACGELTSPPGVRPQAKQAVYPRSVQSYVVSIPIGDAEQQMVIAALAETMKTMTGEA